MEPLLLWLDADSGRYAGAAFGALTATFCLSIVPLLCLYWPRLGRALAIRWLGHPLLFCAVVGLALFAFRWPTFYFPRELNPDESYQISQAMALRTFPIPWKPLDPGTVGPLLAYSLRLAPVLGLPIGFVSARVIGVLCVWGTICMLYLALRRLYADAWARASTWPVLYFFALTKYPDLVHFASELLPMLFLATGVYFVIRALTSRPVHRGALFVAGLVVGATPFTKLQAAPMAVLVAVAGAVALLWMEGPRQRCLRTLGFYVAGGLLFPAALLGMVTAAGALPRFWQLYVISNYHYSHPEGIPAWWIFNYSAIVQDFDAYLKGCLMFLAAGVGVLFVFPQWITSPFRRLAASALLYLGVSLYAVLKPGSTPGHYLLFLVHPMAMLTGLVLAHVGSQLTTGGTRAGGVSRVSLLLLAFIGATVAVQFPRSPRSLQDQAAFAGRLRDFLAAPPSRESQLVLQVARPGDGMVVWGDMPQVFVETRLVMMTARPDSLWQMQDGPLKEPYRQAFIRDMVTYRPALFVDVVAPPLPGSEWGPHGFVERRLYGHETFPELKRVVDEHYVLVAEDPRGPGEGVRVYRRRD